MTSAPIRAVTTAPSSIASRPVRRLAATAFVAALVALVAPLLPGVGAVARADGSSVTVTGSWYRWNPLATDNGDGTFTGAYDTSDSPTVTVDQTQNLVDQTIHVSWAHFAPSSNDSQDSIGPGATTSAANVLYAVGVYQCRGTNPTRSPIAEPTNSKNPQCYPAQVGGVDGGLGQNNALLSVTHPDGTGSVDLHVENRSTNKALGCDSTHPCSVVVVPNNGGNQPSTPDFTSRSGCDDHSQDFLSPPNYDQIYYRADHEYLGYSCSWADRIVVPLHFAPVPSDCPSRAPAFSAVGSPMLARALLQLSSGWCRGTDPLTFDYNSTSNEYEARSAFLQSGQALTSSTDVALVTQPADAGTAGTRKYTYAPVANTSIDVPFLVDNPTTGYPITDLRLNARLVAKLLTQSYQPFSFNCQSAAHPDKPGYGCAPTVAGNPESMFDDPEFQQLNFRGDHTRRSDFPSRRLGLNNDALGGFLPTVLAGDSDLTWELTRWVASDPDARAFLAGQPDPYGMHVNTSYLLPRGAALFPTSQQQALDPGWTAPRGSSQRFSEGFQSTWNPVSGLQNVATTLLGDKSTAADPLGAVCSDGSTNCFGDPDASINFKPVASEPIGVRDLWAVADNTATRGYKFPTAALINTAGNAVTPTTRSMSAALAGMRTNPDKITQYLDHAHEPAGAYPLTEPVYAMVPTCGVSRGTAAGIGSFLQHVVDSQNYGVQPGTLAPGLQALTAKQLVQTRAAASAVSSQSCISSPPDTTIDNMHDHHTGSTRSGDGGGPASPNNRGNTASGSAGASTSNNAAAGTGTTAPTGSTPTTSPTAAGTSPAPKQLGYKPASSAGALSMTLPFVLILGLVLLLGGPLLWWATATTAGRAAVTRMRFWQ